MAASIRACRLGVAIGALEAVCVCAPAPASRTAPAVVRFSPLVESNEASAVMLNETGISWFSGFLIGMRRKRKTASSQTPLR
jgi:hypothetical protein